MNLDASFGQKLLDMERKYSNEGDYGHISKSTLKHEYWISQWWSAPF